MKKLITVLVLIATVACLRAAEWQNDDGVIKTWNAGRFLPPEYRRGRDGFVDVVVLPNTQLANVEVVSSKANANNWTSADIRTDWFRRTLFPYCVTQTSETEVSMLMMNSPTWPSSYNPGSTAEVQLFLYQKGDDVCATVGAARYVFYYNFCGIDILTDPFVSANYQVNSLSIAGAGDGSGFGIDQLTFSVKPSKGKKIVAASETITAGEAMFVGTNVALTVDVAQTVATPKTLDQTVAFGPGAEITYQGFNRATTTIDSGFSGHGASVTFRADLSPIDTDPTGLVIDPVRIPNVKLSEITGATVAKGKKYPRGGDNYMDDGNWVNDVTVCHFRKNFDGTSATFQAQYMQGSVRCVIVTMTQDGDDVVCSYAARTCGEVDIGFDFESAGRGWITPAPTTLDIWHSEWAEPGNTRYFLGLRGIRLLRDDRFAMGEEKYNSRRIRNVKLADVTNIACEQGRVVTGSGNIGYPLTCFWNKTAASITCQIQFPQGTATRCVKVTATQSGDDIALNYIGRSAKCSVGEYAFDGSMPETAFSIVGETGSGLGVIGLWLEIDPAAAAQKRPLLINAATAATNEMYMSDMNVDGDVSLTLRGDSQDFVKILPDGSWLNVTNGAELVIYHSNGRNMLGWYLDHSCGFRIANGSTMILEETPWPLDNFMPIELNGGELRIGGVAPTAGDFNCYMQNLTFRGGMMTGKRPVVGYNTSGRWFVRGTTPSTCETGVRLQGETRAAAGIGPRHFNLVVENVTGDADVDFTMSGVIGNSTTPNGSGIVKKGPGTALLSAANTYDGETRIEEGVLRFGVSDAVLATNVVRMTGGTLSLAAGTTTTLAALAFADAAEATVDFGEGATLVLTEGIDSAGLRRLHFTGAFNENSVRISATCPPAAFSRVRFGNLRVMQNDDGYLVPYTPGMRLIFR